MITPFANRAHNHNWKLDPIIRSLLDLDFYKILMAQFIWKLFSNTRVSFKLINRKKHIRLADIIPRDRLVAQLDHVRTLRFLKSELIWLSGNTFYGTRGIFCPEFIEWLEEFKLPAYRLEEVDGQWELIFEGTWAQTTMWEIYALSIVNELRTRAGLEKMTEFELDILYAHAKSKLWGKIKRLHGVPGLKIADFGTRRRHSFLWQDYVVSLMKSELPDVFVGTSNAYMAYKHNLEAIGTNAHELPMVLAALARLGRLPGIGLKESQYEVLRLWKATYGGAMLVALPDTFGSTQFFRDAPNWVAEEFVGVRPDSKEPHAAIREIIAFFEKNGQDARTKLAIPSDGLDVDSILAIHAEFAGDVKPGFSAQSDFHDASDFLPPPSSDGNYSKWAYNPKIRLSYGWGTMLTNDFVNCHPRRQNDLDAFSLVCKVFEVEGHPAVKLSDNYLKATGPEGEIRVYRAEFGTDGVEGIEVTV